MQHNKESVIVTPEQFTERVAKVYNTQQDDLKSYIEATVQVCEESDIDYEDCKPYMTDALVQMIRVEASKIHLIDEKLNSLELF